MSLSICLVTRNAAQRLPAALASVADLGAQRIVIDTVLNLARCHIRLGDYRRAEACLAPLLGDAAHQAEARSLFETIAALKRQAGLA